MENLNALLKLFTENSRVSICITDFSGISGSGALDISDEFLIHSSAFCSEAKKTPAGYDMCMRCKGVCNRRAVKYARGFSGLCAFGMFEAVRPVEADGKVICVIYVGNGVVSMEKSLAKLEGTSLSCGADYAALSALMRSAQPVKNPDSYFIIAEIVANTVKDLCKRSVFPARRYHRAVVLAMQYARTEYRHPVTLRSIANSIFINEKYLGRIFKEQCGCTFHQYLTGIRLSKAAELLKENGQSVLKTALDCGFNSASYFNRAFVKKYGVTPKQWSKK